MRVTSASENLTPRNFRRDARRPKKIVCQYFTKKTSYYSQTKSSVPVANELMNSFTEK